MDFGLPVEFPANFPPSVGSLSVGLGSVWAAPMTMRLHTGVLIRSTAPRVFQARKNSKFCAHTCPEGGDASKPGPTCDATELLGSRAKERAVQK